MAILFGYKGGDIAKWRRSLAQHLSDVDLRAFPDEVGDPADIEFAMVWRHQHGDLRRYPNLKAILSLGAGIEHLLEDPDLPKGVPIVRLVDEVLALDMGHHVVHWALHFHRNYHVYIRDQAAKRWQRQGFTDAAERRIGILGMGEIGAVAARMMRDLGFPTAGWSRTEKAIEGIRSFAGMAALDDFLGQSDILACVLPATPETDNLLDAERIARLPRGAFVINIGRGGAIDDGALLAALDSGHLAGAALDVFRTEPLPPESPFWGHPKVFVTPHAAGPTNAASAARHVAENIKRVRAGKAPHPVVDLARGY